jgi:hypothetical protein
LVNQIVEIENVGIRSLQGKLRYYALVISSKKFQIQKFNIWVFLKPLQAIYKEISGIEAGVGLDI